MDERAKLREAQEVHDGHAVGVVVRVRFEQEEAEAFARTCDQAMLPPPELLRVAYREYAARHPVASASR